MEIKMEHTGRQTTWKSGRFQSSRAAGQDCCMRHCCFFSLFWWAGRPFGRIFSGGDRTYRLSGVQNSDLSLLTVPAGAGIFSCIRTGVDAWSELAVMVRAPVCRGKKDPSGPVASCADCRICRDPVAQYLSPCDGHRKQDRGRRAAGIRHHDRRLFLFMGRLFSRFEGRAGRASFSCGADGGMDPGGLRNRSRISAVACGGF